MIEGPLSYIVAPIGRREMCAASHAARRVPHGSKPCRFAEKYSMMQDNFAARQNSHHEDKGAVPHRSGSIWAHHRAANLDYVLFDSGWQFQIVLDQPLTIDASRISALAAAPAGN